MPDPSWKRSGIKVDHPRPMPIPALNVVAFDPGGSTGVVVVHAGELVFTGTFGYDQFQENLLDAPWSTLPNTTWVVEDFLIYPWKAQELAFSRCPSARLIGSIELTAKMAGIPVVFHTANAGKSAVSDDLLKIYGWFDKCDSKHSRDAARHALRWLLHGKHK